MADTHWSDTPYEYRSLEQLAEQAAEAAEQDKVVKLELTTDSNMILVECPRCVCLVRAEKWSDHWKWHMKLEAQ